MPGQEAASLACVCILRSDFLCVLIGTMLDTKLKYARSFGLSCFIILHVHVSTFEVGFPGESKVRSSPLLVP